MSARETNGLYPEIKPNRQGMLDVGDGHTLYWEESGNSDGAPVVFLHGGPGGGVSPIHRRFFDPAFYRIILFDQRGAGQSTPTASIENNTTPILIEDIEKLRHHLGVERWLVVGGSWGSTLSLAYGEAHPEQCAGFILRGVFLFTQTEIDWFFSGMGAFFPEAAREFYSLLPKERHKDALCAYFDLLTNPDPVIHMEAALRWYRYESACSYLHPMQGDQLNPGGSALPLARIEAHYMRNQGFLAKDQLLQNIGRIAHLPAVIVQGRYDIVCPIMTADRLARSWPNASFRIVTDAGHSALEPPISRALATAADEFRNSLKGLH